MRLPPAPFHRLPANQQRGSSMQIIPEIAQSHDEIEAIRRDIHAHPELCYEEERTADLVAQKLERASARSACAPTWTRCRSPN
jgi:hypothetical protein